MLSKSQRKRKQANARKLEGLGKTRFSKGLDPQRFATDDQKIQVRERDLGHCRYCQVFVGANGHVDHVRAYSRGGATVITNLVLACEPCNVHKGRKHNMRPKTMKNHIRWINRGGDKKPLKRMPEPNFPPKPPSMVPGHLVVMLGSACKHRASPKCRRITCLEKRLEPGIQPDTYYDLVLMEQHLKEI